VPAGHRP